MPVTLMGFSLQGLSPSRSLSNLSDARAFVTLASSIPAFRKPKLPLRQSTQPRLQGFAPREDSPPAGRGLPVWKAAALLGFYPLGISSLTQPCASAPDPLLSLTPACVRKRILKPALQGLDYARAGLPLSRLPPLMGFLHLMHWPSIRCLAVPGLWIHLSEQPLLPTLNR